MQNERFRVNPAKVVHETIEGEAILIHLDNGFYYSLDGAGAEIWELLAGSRSFDEVAHELDAHYASDPETIAAEVRRLAGELVGEDLLEPTDEAPEVALNGCCSARPSRTATRRSAPGRSGARSSRSRTSTPARTGCFRCSTGRSPGWVSRSRGSRS